MTTAGGKGDKTMQALIEHEPLDILGDLPRSGKLRYPKSHVIYHTGAPATHLYLVLEGRVKVVRTSAEGPEVLLDVYNPEDLFGESVLLNPPRPPEKAIALEPVTLMAWTRAEMYNIIQSRPQFGAALSQMLVQRLIENS